MTGNIISHYRIQEKIGEGGIAEVFLAEDTTLNRKVALKFLSAITAKLPGARARFLREAKSAASIDHPFICKVYETGEIEGRAFIALEFVEGQTLAQRLKAAPLSFDEALTVAMQMAEGLAAAHEREFAHRDIKPANIMISRSGHVKIMDFGLAKHLGKPQGDAVTSPADLHTMQGAVIGTPAYMSPEQVRGEASDVRSDVFSMGLVFFEAFSGIHPFAKQTVQATMGAIIHEQTPVLSSCAPLVPVELSEIVSRMLAKEPAGRYPSACEVRDDLLRLRRSSPDRRPAQRKLAILPFVNLSPDPDQEYFCDGLAEELITALSKLEGLKVASRTSSFRFRGSNVDIREVGERLKVEAVLEGSVRKAGDKIRIVVKLVAVDSGYPVWSERYDRRLDDIFEIQDEISQAIVEKLKPSVHPIETKSTVASQANIRVYELYLKGRYYWNKRTEENLKRSIDHFKLALREDPDYVLALAGLADAYVTLALYGTVMPAEVMPQAKSAAERAISLQPEMAEAITAMACIHSVYDWNWGAAERAFKRAIHANPSYAGAHHWYAINCLAPAGRFDEAQAAIQRAWDVDPLSLATIATAGLVSYFARDYDTAILRHLKALELDSDFALAHYFLGQAYLQKRMFDEAIAELERAVALSNRSPESLAVLGYAYAVAGNKVKAEEFAREVETLSKDRYVSPVLLAWIRLGFGDNDRAIRYLERACDWRATDLIWIRVRPAFDAIRLDPRFEELCSRVGL